MYTKLRSFSKIHSKSFLIGILHLIGLLSLYRDDDKRRGHPYVYPTSVMLRCRVVMIWMRIPSNNCLHQYFKIDMPYNRHVMMACGLHTLPDRRTFDRRFKVLPIGSIISTMGRRFALEGLADQAIASVDSTLVTAKGPMWHWNHIKKGIIPRPGIDKDERMDVWIQDSHGIFHRRSCRASCSRGYSCKHTRPSAVLRARRMFA